MDIRQAIAAVVAGEGLSEENAFSVMEQIMTGEATPAQVASFLTALRIKGETVEEITGFARVMREKADAVSVDARPVLDTCGTGGDQKETLNISTVSAFVVAGAGVTVAKHGNRSVSSRSGSADVLVELGVKVDVPKAVVEKCLQEIGIGFLFAPLLHQAMKHAIGPRREIGIRTVFNLLGPLTNPARATHQLMGVYDGNLTTPLAEVLGNLGTEHAMVVHGEEGLDEVSLSSPTRVSEVENRGVREYTLCPEDVGLARAPLEVLKGGDPEACARAARDVLAGGSGPRRDVVLLNSGAALYVAGRSSSIAEGVRLAQESIDSGKAQAKLDGLIRITNAS